MNCFQGKGLNFFDPFFHLRKIIEPIFLFTKAWEKTTSNVAHILALQTRINKHISLCFQCFSRVVEEPDWGKMMDSVEC